MTVTQGHKFDNLDWNKNLSSYVILRTLFPTGIVIFYIKARLNKIKKSPKVSDANHYKFSSSTPIARTGSTIIITV